VAAPPSGPGLADRVVAIVRAHPAVREVRFVGSRAEGRATVLSDWDFLVEVENFGVVGDALPRLVAPLEPLAQQWDRLSSRRCWMLILAGPAKVDLIFPDEPHRAEPAWKPARDNLDAIDAHFWDWMLWLAAKHARGNVDLVGAELKKLFGHLLVPLGAKRRPRSIAAAVAEYRAARAQAEARFAVVVDRGLEAAVAPALARIPP
jgi:hypothetical protein